MLTIKEWLVKIKKFIVAYQLLFLFFIILGTIIDVFFLKKTSEIMIVLISSFWIIFLYAGRLEGRFSIFIGLAILLTTGFFYALSLEDIAEKTAIWAFVFLSIGVIQQLIENRLAIKNLKEFTISWSNFLQKRNEVGKWSVKPKK